MVLAEGVLGLAVVHLVVAGNEDDGRTALAVDERQRLARGGLLHAEKRGEVGDSAGVGRVDALELAGLALGDGDPGRGGLGVGGKAAVAPNELGLACVGQGHELDGGVSADLAGVSNDGQGLHAAALCDAGVGGLLVVIALLQGLLRGGEGIGVLHDELAAAHETEAGAPLVAELVLNLIERDGQLLVAAKLVADEVGEGLLVGGAEDEVALVAVLQAHELRAVGAQTVRLLPELGRGDDGDHHLLRADALHLVPDDVLHLGDDAPGERKVAVETGGGLADHAGAKQQLVADELGLSRVLLERGGVEPRHLLVALHVNAFRVGNARRLATGGFDSTP